MNEKPNAEIPLLYQYCTLKVDTGLFSSKVKFEIDLGTDSNLLGKYSQTIIDKTQQVTNYNHLIDALNYLATLGWEVVSVYYQEFSGTTYNNPQYLMKRRVNV